MIKKHSSSDALLLAILRVFSLAVNFLSVSVLSHVFSLSEYGTYSAGELVVSVAASMTMLGMMDAANYYYNLDHNTRRERLNSIAFIQLVLGFAAALTIFFGKHQIAVYFKNPTLTGIWIYIAFRPALVNISNSLLTLQIAIGKARLVAIRNLFFTLLRFAAVLLAAFVTRNIYTMFIALMILDLLTVVYYYSIFRRNAFPIYPFQTTWNSVRTVLLYAVPMGIYVFSGTLMKDMDKLVIGHYESSASLAIYTNCSAALPLTIVSASFFTVLLPVLTVNVQREQWEKSKAMCSAYLRIGYITTLIFAGACALLSDEVIRLLYGESYLAGQIIFLIYLLVDAVKFANTTMILTAKGRTGYLMAVSLISLAANAVLNLLLYHLIGFLGPAIASVAVSLGITFVLLRQSAIIVKTSVRDLLQIPELICFLVKVSFCFIVSMSVKKLMIYLLNPHFAVVILTMGIVFTGMAFLLSRVQLLRAIGTFNETCK